MNQTKVEILHCLADGDWWTTSEVAEVCGLGLSNVSELLRRYRSQSLVNRHRNNEVPNGYLYRISDVGLARLEYLTSEEMKTSQVIAGKVGLTGAKRRVLDGWIKQRLGG